MPTQFELGQSFKISPMVYQFLIQTIVTAKEGGMEPSQLEPLKDRTGAVCTLYGRKYVYQIRIETHFLVPVVCLDIGGMDVSPSSFRNIGGGDAENPHNWELIVAMLLKAEGFIKAELPELDICL
jgi:hypothetical protein